MDPEPHMIRTTITAHNIPCLLLALAFGSGMAAAADLTFNIELVGQSDPLPGSPYYADVWAEDNYAYVGSDRTGGGVSIFDIFNPFEPQFVTMYAGNEMEDVEVHNGVGFFGSDVSTTSGTGVDIVDLSNPANPVRLNRVNALDGGHNKVHTLTVSKGFLYTSDNATDVVKIFNVATPSSPQFVKSLVLGAPQDVASHEVVVSNDRLYVASKQNNTEGLECCGWTHIFDVANPAQPVLLKKFLSGPRSHTASPTADGKTLVVAEERPNGNVHLYDISMIDRANDPDDPVLLKTLSRTSVGIDAHSPHHPHLHGNLLFLSWYEAGLQVFNIADPANPVHVGAYDTYPGTSTLFYGNWGSYLGLGLSTLLLSDRQRGLIIVDATDVLTPGDYNQDGLVNASDYAAWRSEFSQDVFHHGTLISDGNGDGFVDAADYVVWRANTLAGGASGVSAAASSMAEAADSAAAVPEPGSLIVLIVAGGSFSCFSSAGRRRAE
ncbi:MAG TPA: dockerin type I domain-containing protein [Lacipirellulaceae bacterium]